jgi:hypothetical protein
MLAISFAQQLKLDKALAGVKNGVPKALTPAINRALEAGRTVVRRQIREVYEIKQKDIPTNIRKANYSSLKGQIEIRDGMLDLAKFKVQPSSVQKRKNKRTIRATVKKGGGGLIPHAFVAQMRGYKGPFMRYKGVGRLPIHRLLAIGAPIMASQANVGPVANKKIGDVLAKRIDHEIKRVLAQGGKPA